MSVKPRIRLNVGHFPVIIAQTLSWESIFPLTYYHPSITNTELPKSVFSERERIQSDITW